MVDGKGNPSAEKQVDRTLTDSPSAMGSSRRQQEHWGTAGLRSLCDAAKENGISALYDEFAADDPSGQDDGAVTVRRIL